MQNIQNYYESMTLSAQKYYAENQHIAPVITYQQYQYPLIAVTAIDEDNNGVGSWRLLHLASKLPNGRIIDMNHYYTNERDFIRMIHRTYPEQKRHIKIRDMAYPDMCLQILMEQYDANKNPHMPLLMEYLNIIIPVVNGNIKLNEAM